ncbi:hypothetical protein LTR10_020546 [Elasticomyces elasticus]|uniref:Uncharacterized protein n=1 Tax=Exophiala sideris TaxID=1016849 RepID=A0ABR0J4P8_9EURO|nr:hypothetical protein LTR10_020546 [Elasticomyces elasticus]KAK5027285.1 hypothetical protein LTS07_006885 [Exophiala sideris]KAK5035013.1 hypothetical protein LTR13_006197 [Exophiala sideris]KAK5056253.1 hypothetical protein LTR69_007792 [Exophiala sideris]KAK5181257.1 hypothetical protein LTR44_006590 [Eurotiomycetes sp. CCFEE 6388]
MPPYPGEEILATVYTDLHTYFDTPTTRPFLHRFDKSSYFYVYYNSTRQTSRVEVALNPGTPDQAAFNGYLDNVKFEQSRHFPTRLTLTVDATGQPSASPASARSSKDPDEWRLASADPRDPGTTKYRIHTVDFYFWNEEDARLILTICKKLSQPHQVETDEPEVSQAAELDAEPEPQHQHDDLASPVVQNLEHMAISDPAYQKGRPQHGATVHDRTTQQPPPSQAATPAHAAASPSPTSSTAANVDRKPAASAAPTGYAPLAYNPAVPPAPEPIAHREDTPPPADATDGTGLSNVARHDTYSHPQQPHTPFTGVPSPQQNQYGQHYGSPPPSFGPGASATPSFGPHASATPSFGPQAGTPMQPSFGGPQSHPSSSPLPSSHRTSVSAMGATPSSATSAHSHNHSTAAQHYVPGNADPNAHIFGGQQQVQSPGTQFYSTINANGQPHKPLQHVQPQYPDYLSAKSSPSPPVGGYADYHYGHGSQPQGQPQPQGAGTPYDIHNQVYRPTEEEHASHHHHKPSRSSSSQQPSGVERIEKGVGKFFKRIEKRIG